jgi:hypothetical protein
MLFMRVTDTYVTINNEWRGVERSVQLSEIKEDEPQPKPETSTNRTYTPWAGGSVACEVQRRRTDNEQVS